LNDRFRNLYRATIVASLVLVFALLEGCYYMQAFSGQMEVLRKRRPVAEVIADDSTDEDLRERLKMVQDARQFAVDELLLPENGSYRSYTDLERDFVVWNVFAAPEFSLTPRQWCYPVAGCVAYRGYFAKEKATGKARKLEKDGYDVFVGGVTAYSTLGRFDDPVLNTMMNWSDTNLVQTLFHELAHQKLYVSGDTAFNESFATAVAGVGIERWRLHNNLQQEPEEEDRTDALVEAVQQRAARTRKDLEAVYSSDMDVAEMRSRKKEILDALSEDAQAMIDVSGLPVQNWLTPPLNNARLASSGVYESNLPAFRILLDDCANDLACFYEKSSELAELDFDQRQEQLTRLGGS
jgi:predicted aminopeptidase